MKFYIWKEDPKAVHFDLDEGGHHEISTKDSQSLQGIVYFFISKSYLHLHKYY